MGSEGPLILAIDTSGAHCAAAVVQGEITLAEATEAMAKGQAERLFPLIESLLSGADRAYADLDAIAVCIGPGNFTGIRIGVSAARGLAFALARPAIGVTRLEALAFGAAGVVATSVAGPRGQLYAQVFSEGAPLGAPATGTVETVARDLAPARPARVVGAAAEALAALLGCAAGPAADSPRPSVLARIAAPRIAAPGPRPAPLYLRPPDAAPSAESPPAILP